MARGVNKVILVGSLGADPESRNTATGSVVTNIRLATTESWRDKQSGEQRENTEWHRIVFFGRTAEVAAEYLGKGQQVYVEGKLQTRKWQAKDGSDRWSTEVLGSDLQMLGKRGENQFGGDGGRSERPNPPRSTRSPSSPTQSENFDSDIPF